MDLSKVDIQKSYDYAALRTVGDLIQAEIDKEIGQSMRLQRFDANPITARLKTLLAEMRSREGDAYQQAYELAEIAEPTKSS